MSDPEHPYREQRPAGDIPAKLRREGGSLMHVKVVNMSNKGCRVQHKKTLWMGEQVELELPELPHSCHRTLVFAWQCGTKVCILRKQMMFRALALFCYRAPEFEAVFGSARLRRLKESP